MQQSRYLHGVALGAALVVSGWFSQSATAAEIPGFTGWDSKTVGDTEQGSASIDANGVLTVSGAGQDTWGREDEFHIVYKPLKGDGSVTTRLLTAEVGEHSEWSKFGIMVRNDLENPAASVLQLHVTTGHGGDYLFRGLSDPENGASNEASSDMGKDDKLATDGANFFKRELPIWLKIERRGDRFTGYVSKDNQLWTPVTRALQIDMKEEVFAGMYVLGILETMLTATFDGKVSDVSNTLLKPEQATPLQPDPVSVTGGNDSVTLSWNPVDHLGHMADGYVVYRAGPGETTFTEVKRLAGDQTSYVDTTVKNGEMARYRVTTVVTIGDKTLETQTLDNGKLIEVTGAPHPPLKIGSADFFSTVLDGGGNAPSTNKPGGASQDGDVVTLKAGGWGIGAKYDGGQALLTPVTGDFTFTARILGPPTVEGGDVNAGAKFGIAVRESTEAESRNAGMLITPDQGIRAPHRRLFTTMPTDDRAPSGDAPTYPVFLRIQRVKDEIRMSTSADGTTYTAFGDPATTVLSNLRQNVYVGLVGTSGDNDAEAQAQFDRIELTTP